MYVLCLDYKHTVLQSTLPLCTALTKRKFEIFLDKIPGTLSIGIYERRGEVTGKIEVEISLNFNILSLNTGRIFLAYPLPPPSHT